MCKGDATPDDSKGSKRAGAPAVVSLDAEMFAGVVKSYNERRGFGFLACDETARRYGRDVYLSKVESMAAIKDDEDTLKEGDHVVFAVVPSEEGFPQAAAVQRLHLLRGIVQHYSKEQGGAIICNEDGGVPGTREAIVKPSDCGCLELFPGDEVSFCMEKAEDGRGAPEAKLLQLLTTSRPPSALLSCFSLVFPRLDANSVVLSGHAFGTSICLSGVPEDLSECELMKLFGRFGAQQCIVLHSQGSGCASVQFPDAKVVAHFLTGKTHAFTDQTNTLVAELRPPSGPAKLPALSAPSIIPGDACGVLVSWEPLNLASSYMVEIRTVGAQGWSPVDCVGRVQPAGAAASLGPQQSCLAIGGLSAGVAYEARVSYVASCGCMGTASDPSIPCIAGWTAAAPSIPSLPPTQPTLSAPNVHPSLFASSPCSQLHSASIQTNGAVTPVSSQAQLQCVAAPSQQMPYSFCMPETAMQFPPSYENPLLAQAYSDPAMGGLPVLQIPQQPEIRIAGAGDAISVHWNSTGPLAISYVIELRDSLTSASNRFVRMAPPEAVGSLELCIQGLEPGRSYIVCVRSVGSDGMESPPSAWSCWLTLPLLHQPYDYPYSNMPATYVPSTVQQPTVPPDPLLLEMHKQSLQKPAEQQLGMQPVVETAPEVTGQEEMVLFLD